MIVNRIGIVCFLIFVKCYLEPFAGRGNVYFAARKSLDFTEWHLSDLDVSFFKSLIEINLDTLPLAVSRQDFDYYRQSNCDVARVIESRITFSGKGYKYGFDGGDPSHPPYNGKLYKETCTEARRLLSDASIWSSSWDKLNWSLYGPKDFVYLDPPYYGTKASYENIDHYNLLSTLNDASFRWAISGYENELYESNLKYLERFACERNSEIKGSNHRSYSPINEVLWTNYQI